MSNTNAPRGMSYSLTYAETIRRLLLSGYVVYVMDPKGEMQARVITLRKKVGEINE